MGAERSRQGWPCFVISEWCYHGFLKVFTTGWINGNNLNNVFLFGLLKSHLFFLLVLQSRKTPPCYAQKRRRRCWEYVTPLILCLIPEGSFALVDTVASPHCTFQHWPGFMWTSLPGVLSTLPTLLNSKHADEKRLKCELGIKTMEVFHRRGASLLVRCILRASTGVFFESHMLLIHMRMTELIHEEWYGTQTWVLHISYVHMFLAYSQTQFLKCFITCTPFSGSVFGYLWLKKNTLSLWLFKKDVESKTILLA